MLLSKLLHKVLSIDPALDCEITGLSQDSREVKPGYLFFAYPGSQADGRDFIEQAIHQGAVAVLMEKTPFVAPKNKAVILEIEHVADYLSLISAQFYAHPSEHLDITGVTGSNGKTSCTHFIASALQELEQTCGVMGTLGYGLYPHLQKSLLTTPHAIELQKLLAEFLEQRVRHVAMEVSSHRLAQHCLDGVVFNTAVFTNLTRDHLDYHGTMQNYAEAKRILFDLPNLRHAVLNADDPCTEKWLPTLVDRLPVFVYSLTRPTYKFQQISHVYAQQVHLDGAGIRATVYTPWGDGVLHNPHLIGLFNLSNLLAALTVLGILGIPLEKILYALSQVKSVPGRMQTLGGGDKPLVVVDFAHTPDALKQALRALRSHCRGKLWCVFGCGGDRDRGKRPLMAEIAETYADQVVVTDDNSRHENPKDIVADIMQGFLQPHRVVIEHDRQRAIAHAVGCAHAEDIVLIAGKGHETYQIVGDEQMPFSDVVEVGLLMSQEHP